MAKGSFSFIFSHVPRKVAVFVIQLTRRLILALCIRVAFG